MVGIVIEKLGMNPFFFAKREERVFLFSTKRHTCVEIRQMLSVSGFEKLKKFRKILIALTLIIYEHFSTALLKKCGLTDSGTDFADSAFRYH